MGGAGETLAWQLRVTGYGPELLPAITEATLPTRDQDALLSEHELAALVDAVEVLAQAGWRAATLPAALEYCREHFGERWRAPFWRGTVRVACRHFNSAPRYGVSPLETDPVRLARWGPAPDWAATPSAPAGPGATPAPAT